jgi:hypothetical protein
MKCQRAIEILYTHAGIIPARAGSEAVRDHLETCPTCDHWEHTLWDANEEFGNELEMEAPEQLRGALEEKIREREAKHV